MNFDRNEYIQAGTSKKRYTPPDPYESKQLAVRAFECQYMDYLYRSKDLENLSTLCATMRVLDHADKVIIEDNYHEVIKKYPCIDAPNMI